MNYTEAVDILARKSFNMPPGGDKAFTDDIKKGKFSSFFETTLKTKKPPSNVQFALKTSTEEVKTETKTSQRAFPWRVFSFDKKDKTKTEENQNSIASMVTPIKSR
jgi:hypothetical protein